MVNNSSSVVVRSSSPGVCFLSIPQFDPHNMNRPDSVHPTWTFLVAVNGLAAPPTIVVNIFVILVVVRDENLRSASFNVLLTSLAVTDFLVGLLVEPLYCLFLGCLQNNCLLPDCTFTAYVCSFIFCGGSTIVSFTIASVERYLAIEHLNFYLKNITVKKVMITTVIAWVIHSAYLFITSVLLNESHPDQFKVPAAISVGILCMITLYCSSKVQLTAYRQSRIIARQIATVKETNNEQQQEQEQRLQEYKRVFTMTISLRSYNNKPSSSQLHQCSNVLAQALGEVNSAGDQPQEELQISALSLQTSFQLCIELGDPKQQQRYLAF
ncbi:Dopamine D2-like receptor [Exaiptasia diaphana]|nr:Dopamine D2-like receptor [Exaiptasia diaphana]